MGKRCVKRIGCKRKIEKRKEKENGERIKVRKCGNEGGRKGGR